MSKKRLITMFVSLCIIIVLCVLGGVVFVVSDIQVVRQNMDNSSTEDLITNEDIIKKANIGIGKSIFAISESKVVSNVETNFPTLKVKGIERIFPNKIIIKVIERVPTIAIKYKDKDKYLILDNNMCAIDEVVSATLDGTKYSQITLVQGFELFVSGSSGITFGKVLPETLGQEVVVVQHILAGLLEKNVKPSELSMFMSDIRFIANSDTNKIANINTKRGVTIRIDYTNMKDDKKVVYNRIQKAYDCYSNLVDEQQKSSGYLIYNEKTDSYYHKLNL